MNKLYLLPLNYLRRLRAWAVLLARVGALVIQGIEFLFSMNKLYLLPLNYVRRIRAWAVLLAASLNYLRRIRAWAVLLAGVGALVI